MGTAQIIRVGVVQAAPVFLDKQGSTEKAVGFIREAGKQGVQLLAFPEGFIPAHPVWYHFHPATGADSLEMATELFENAVEIPGPETAKLCAAAREAGTAVVIGICERRPDTAGTLFNSQLFIERDGRIAGKHQKLTPTVGERLVHTGGYGDTLGTLQMAAGRVSGLICGENSNPLAIAAISAGGAQIHVASWPNNFSRNEGQMCDVVNLASRSLAYKSGAFVLNSCSIISDEMVERIAYVDEDRAFLAERENGGGSSIVAPDATVIAGPMGGKEEGLLVADIDLRECIKAKTTHDYAGHYNRADVFNLVIDRHVPSLFQEGGSRSEGTAPSGVDADDQRLSAEAP